MLKRLVNNYFGFNKQQRNGLFVLLLVSFVLLVFRLAYPTFITPDPIVLLDLPLIEKKLDSSYAARTFQKKHNTRYSTAAKQLFVFDPNRVSREQLLQLGLKEKTADIFIKFRNKGFVFREKSDLQKVYGISGRLYNTLEPYILIAEKADASEPKTGPIPVPENKPVARPARLSVELNSADSAALMDLDGIGEAYARRILKYRTLLGGFVSVEQLKEVYGFNELLFEKIKDHVTVDTRNIRKINLNKDAFKLLNKHPYLSYELTKSIFDWRRKTALTAENLKDILNDTGLYHKLLPYLTFD